jgi:L-ribulose-5-phosphate 3-epimerase
LNLKVTRNVASVAKAHLDPSRVLRFGAPEGFLGGLTLADAGPHAVGTLADLVADAIVAGLCPNLVSLAGGRLDSSERRRRPRKWARCSPREVTHFGGHDVSVSQANEDVMTHRPPSHSSRGATLPSRRNFLRASSVFAVLGSMPGLGVPVARAEDERGGPVPFKLSLSQRSLRREFAAAKLDPLDFPRVASGLGIDAVAYVSEFYDAKLTDRAYLAELKRRAAGEGVWSELIMVDGEGELGAPDEKSRRRAVDHHKKWVEAAAFLGCHAVSVQATSKGTEDDQVKWVSDGLRRLCKFSEPFGIDILIENHAGFSAMGSWVVEVLNAVGHARCGSRPDFGNFNPGNGSEYDRYQGVRELMPFARAVSAKAYDFDDRGEETRINYAQMLKIVTDAGYRGYVGIEYEGDRLSEQAGIARTKQLLERVRTRLAPRTQRR